MNFLKTAASVAVIASMAASAAFADGHATTKLRMQTHFSPEQLSGKMAAKFIDDIEMMSNGEIAVEMFYSSSVVKSVETFDAAATGILDCDMTGGGYQTGKNPAFQFAGDLLGGYQNPQQNQFGQLLILRIGNSVRLQVLQPKYLLRWGHPQL